MGEPVRAICPNCRNENLCRVVFGALGADFVRCPVCAHEFVPAPAVTEVRHGLDKMVRDADQALRFAKEDTVKGALARLKRYLATYPDYLGRDRDILLMHIVEKLDAIERRVDEL